MKAIQISAAGRAVKARPVIKLSSTGRLALSLGLLLLCGLGAVYCMARVEATNSLGWKLAFLGCWLPAIPTIIGKEGGDE